MKTYQPKGTEIKRDWHLIDAKGQVLRRVATKIATLLMGKQKPGYSAHADSGDIVVVINATKVKVTGKKEREKEYISHSGYPGGLKSLKFFELMERDPKRIIEKAVHGMLPKNRLNKERMGRLHVFADENHQFEKMFSKAN